MVQKDSNNKRIAKNTIFLYGRTLLLLCLSLYTSRVALQALGVENYGIINIVSGFVSMFALLNGSLTSACQRFITFELGKDGGDVRKVFSASFFIHLVLAIIIVLIAETFGLYFVNHKLNLPAGSLGAVQWLFQCSIIAFVLNLINIPYNALIVAHEKMKAFAYISILEALCKFLTVFSLLYFSDNQLVWYAIFTLLSSTLVRFVYNLYCRHNFSNDCKIERLKDKELLKKIFNFAGWAFIGNSATLLTNQGVNIVLNLFLGVTINAARGIAVQVEAAISNFVYSFTTALNPQITKSFASNDIKRLSSLIDMGVRISFFLIIAMCIPVIIATPEILNLWLGVYPDYTVIFIRLTLLSAIVQATANPLMTLIYASGNINLYQIIVGLLVLLNLPISYILLYYGCDPKFIYVVNLLIYLMTFVVRMAYVRIKLGLNIDYIIGNLFLRLCPVLIIASIISYFLYHVIMCSNSIYEIMLFALCSVIVTSGSIFLIGLKKNERSRLMGKIFKNNDAQ